jgi:ribosomal protein S18 acetylase RimI-like enzyme
MEGWLLRNARAVEPNPEEVRALGRFRLDAWRRAGRGALGWTGATDDTIREISSEEYLKGLVSSPKMKFFSCEENGEITGFAVNRIQDGSTMELAGIIVREDQVGKGIGSLLLSKCIEFARAERFQNMVVKTETSNERAIAFYLKNEFVRVGDTVETFVSSKVELAVLRRSL